MGFLFPPDAQQAAVLILREPGPPWYERRRVRDDVDALFVAARCFVLPRGVVSHMARCLPTLAQRDVSFHEAGDDSVLIATNEGKGCGLSQTSFVHGKDVFFMLT